MSRSVQLNLPPSLVQTVDLGGQSSDPKGQRGLTSLLADSVDASGCSEKEAAREMGYDPAYWTRIKSGEKAAHLERVGRLPEKVQREFVKRYAQELRMTVSEQDAQKQAALDLAKAALSYLEMAK